MTVPRSLRIAVGFLSRVPADPGGVTEIELGRAVAWFPAVGAALGLGLAVVARGLGPHLPPALTATALVALLALATGGLHLDGVADVFDGLGGGRGDRARTLAIMRDSRIGAHGATALALVLAAKVAAVASIVAAHAIWPLWVAPAVARAAATLLVLGFPYARPSGLGRAMRDHARARDGAIAVASAAAVVAVTGMRAVVPALAALVTAGTLAVAMHRRLGGLTGDVYGAAIELAELTVLVAATVR